MGNPFKRPKAPPPPPPVKEATPIPDADNKAVKTANRKRVASLAQKSGRASTILTTDDNGKLGG